MINFHDWLSHQPEERKQEILAGERQYLASRDPVVEERAFEESLVGFEDRPAGGLTYARPL